MEFSMDWKKNYLFIEYEESLGSYSSYYKLRAILLFSMVGMHWQWIRIRYMCTSKKIIQFDVPFLRSILWYIKTDQKRYETTMMWMMAMMIKMMWQDWENAKKLIENGNYRKLTNTNTDIVTIFMLRWNRCKYRVSDTRVCVCIC